MSGTNQRNLYRIIIGALMIVSGIIGAAFTQGGSIFSAILLTGGCAFLVVGVIRHHQYGEGPESDERSEKIGAYGLSYAWVTGILFGIILAGFNRHFQVGNTRRSRNLFDGAGNFCCGLSDLPV